MGPIDDFYLLLGHRMIRIFKWLASFFVWLSFKNEKEAGKKKGAVSNGNHRLLIAETIE